MSAQPRHPCDAVGCGNQSQQQQQPSTFYCSRSVEETLASCFDVPGSSTGGGCGQMMGRPVDVEDLANFCNFASNQQQQTQQQYNVAACAPQQQQQQQYHTAPCAPQQQPQQYNATPCVAQQQQQQYHASPCATQQQQQQYNATPCVSQQQQHQYNATPCIAQQQQQQYNATPCVAQQQQQQYNATPCIAQQQQQQYNATPCVAQQQQPQQFNCCEYTQQPQQQRGIPQQPVAVSQVQLPPQPINPSFYAPMTLEEAAFNYCTDSRWLACPATSYCPLYDATQQPLESWQALPCAQDFYNYYVPDEDALEEYLSNEKRKEKSRDAARCRRSRETDIFTELAAALPVPPCEAAHLDKASVMRLAIAYLKTRTVMDSVPKPVAKPEILPEMDELSLKAMDGFVFVLDNNGDMVYLSPNVKDYLGIPQMDLMGQSVFDYSHPCDHDEIRESFSIKASDVTEDHPCNFFLRLKCTLTNKGRKVNLKSASYKVIHCTGRLFANVNNTNISNSSDSENSEEIVEREPGVSLVVIASPVPHPSNIEVPLGKYTFLSKHNLNMKFTYADDKLADFLGWESSELMGQSVFDFYHALDNLSLDKSFKSLFHKGQCETMAYRFLNKRGGYAWVVTQATLIHCSRLQKPLSVVCVNYLLSGVECEDEVYSVRQLDARTSRLKESSEEEEEQSTPVVPAPRKPLADKPVAVTASLFRFQERPKPTAQVQAVQPRPRIDGKENNIEERRQVKAKPNASVQPICDPKREPCVQLPPTTAAVVAAVPPPPAYVAPSIPQEPTLYNEPAPVPPLVSGNSNVRPPPQTATASIFVPRTEDMNKGFLTFSDDQPGLTMLKDEPEDLTHLAPTAGDVCVPLDDPPFLTVMLDEFILNSNYCPLLSPEMTGGPAELTETNCNNNNTNSSSRVCNNNNNDALKDVEQTILSDPLRRDDCSSSDGDPFIYRDSPSRCSLGTDLHSPTLTKSPDGSRIGDDSLSSPPGSGGGLSEDEMLMLSISDVMADDELALRAPYIPMSDQDEALQLLISDDMVMWGPSQSTDKKSKWLTDAGEENANSSLAQLLTNETSSKQMKDHGGTLVNPTQVLGQISLKNTTRDITADRERANKRAYAFSAKSSGHHQENKRIKHNDGSAAATGHLSSLENLLSASVQNSQLLQQLVSQQTPKMTGIGRSWTQPQQQDQRHREHSNDVTSFYEDPNLCSRANEEIQGGSSNLRRGNVFEDDGGGRTAQRQQQQSNSVLMNLLVSGCDLQSLQNQLQDLSGLSETRMLLQQNKLSPLQINVEERLQTVPQWSNSSSPLNSNDQLSSPIKHPPLQQLHLQQQQQAPTSFEPMDYDVDDELGFISASSMLQDTDLLRALDSNLV